MKKFSDLFIIMAIWSIIIAFMIGCNSEKTNSQNAGTKADANAHSPSKQLADQSQVQPSEGTNLTLNHKNPMKKKSDVPFSSAPLSSVSDQLYPQPKKLIPSNTIKTTAPKITKVKKIANLSMPSFALSDQHEKTCRILPGDQLPLFQVKDLSGQETAIHSLLGKQASVILFWRADYPYAVEALSNFQTLIQSPYNSRGVKIIAINVGNTAAEIQKVMTNEKIQIESYQDPTAAGWKKFTQGEKLPFPRIYLTNAEGKVVWLDLEYSCTTRRDLVQAIEYLLNL